MTTDTTPRYRTGSGSLIVDTQGHPGGIPRTSVPGAVIADAYGPENAARIVAALNHAEQLAEALRQTTAALREAGFDEDEPINGGDTVELVAELYPRMRDALAQYEAARRA